MSAVYLDHAATTRPEEAVITAMAACMQDCWANPSAVYGEAWKPKRELRLARQALGYYSRVLDGREAGGLLADWLRERLSLAGSRELMDLSQSIQQDTFRDPGISRWVDEAAQAGDPVAEALITQAGRLVAQLALGVIRQLHFPYDEPVTVGVWGSVIVNSRLHREAFTQAIHADYPLAQIIIPEKDAADGALMMALQLCR